MIYASDDDDDDDDIDVDNNDDDDDDDGYGDDDSGFEAEYKSFSKAFVLTISCLLLRIETREYSDIRIYQDTKYC